MWKMTIKNFPIWYFDATCNVHKEITGSPQKKPYFYSIGNKSNYKLKKKKKNIM